MTDIFLSYAREDVEWVREFVHACDFDIFWDQVIPGGDNWLRHLEEELEEADCVIVIWSRASVKSPWVAIEARAGLRADKLVAARIDRVEPPPEFRDVEARNLTRWQSGRRGREFVALVRAIESKLGEHPPEVEKPVGRPRTPSIRSTARLLYPRREPGRPRRISDTWEVTNFYKGSFVKAGLHLQFIIAAEGINHRVLIDSDRRKWIYLWIEGAEVDKVAKLPRRVWRGDIHLTGGFGHLGRPRTLEVRLRTEGRRDDEAISITAEVDGELILEEHLWGMVLRRENLADRGLRRAREVREDLGDWFGDGLDE